jgi:type IX secretion system substrate protein
MKRNFIKKSSSFISIIVGMLSISFAFGQGVEPVNSIIGDISFIKKFDHSPNAATNENLRIKTHLAYVENLLRQRDVSAMSSELQLKRNHLLNLLHDYWTREIFPRNYDYKNQTRPCFIDKDGTICAVGYLVEQTAGRKAAEIINSKHKYDRITEMKDKIVDDWINNSGLTREECAMIQPQYPYYCFCEAQPVAYATCVTNGNGKHSRCRKDRRLAIAGKELSSDETSQTTTYAIPVSNSTSVSIFNEQTEKISLKAYDMAGRLIATIADTRFKEGRHEIPWDTKELNPGIYLLQAKSEEFTQTLKLVVMN